MWKKKDTEEKDSVNRAYSMCVYRYSICTRKYPAPSSVWHFACRGRVSQWVTEGLPQGYGGRWKGDLIHPVTGGRWEGERKRGTSIYFYRPLYRFSSCCSSCSSSSSSLSLPEPFVEPPGDVLHTRPPARRCRGYRVTYSIHAILYIYIYTLII